MLIKNNSKKINTKSVLWNYTYLIHMHLEYPWPCSPFTKTDPFSSTVSIRLSEDDASIDFDSLLSLSPKRVRAKRDAFSKTVSNTGRYPRLQPR
uniref:Ovule protein n=1 Tax=Steinernema glaseri TaxID=37863 RepID=A0A1I7YSU0_9BILA